MIPDKLEFTITSLAEYKIQEQWVINELDQVHDIPEPDIIQIEPVCEDYYKNDAGLMVQDYKILCVWVRGLRIKCED